MDPKNNYPINTNNPIIQSGTGGGKEKEAAGSAPEMPYASGVEVNLPKEVAEMGVSQRPTNIPIPQPVSQWVKPVGENVPVEMAGEPITLPITHEEIAEGLKQPWDSSWHWLSEWCKRRVKQIQFWRK